MLIIRSSFQLKVYLGIEPTKTIFITLNC